MNSRIDSKLIIQVNEFKKNSSTNSGNFQSKFRNTKSVHTKDKFKRR